MIELINNGFDCWLGDKEFVKYIVCFIIEWCCYFVWELSEIKKYVFVYRNDVIGVIEICFLIENLISWLYWEELLIKCFKLGKYIY